MNAGFFLVFSVYWSIETEMWHMLNIVVAKKSCITMDVDYFPAHLPLRYTFGIYFMGQTQSNTKEKHSTHSFRNQIQQHYNTCTCYASIIRNIFIYLYLY